MKSTPTNCPTIELSLPGAYAFTTLRDCADPDSPYDGFNACHYTGDAPGHIAGCRTAASIELGLASPDLLILPRQTHTADVAVVDRHSTETPLDNIDGIVTADSMIGIGISTADCVPLLMSDPEAGVIAAVHSGWRGTVKRIGANAVEAMTRLGASPEKIVCVLGPYIHTEAYEVGPELIDTFIKEFGSRAKLWRMVAGKPHLDLAFAVGLVLKDAGIMPENISDCGICSYSSYGRVFSARRLGIASGRTLTAARLQRSKASM